MPHLQRRLQILLSEEQHSLLDELSRKEHCSLAELIRRALEQNYLASSSYKALASLKRLEESPLFSEEQWKKIYRNRQEKT